jgi:hypothetical protein
MLKMLDRLPRHLLDAHVTPRLDAAAAACLDAALPPPPLPTAICPRESRLAVEPAMRLQAALRGAAPEPEPVADMVRSGEGVLLWCLGSVPPGEVPDAVLERVVEAVLECEVDHFTGGGVEKALRGLMLGRPPELRDRLLVRAAAAGRPGAMRWLRAAGARWDERVAMAAADADPSSAALDWALLNGCPAARLRGRYLGATRRRLPNPKPDGMWRSPR